tara:strand:+ start:81 stop:569 length:489 start_codon:yes stop_codon:yes gene_type:complete
MLARDLLDPMIFDIVGEEEMVTFGARLGEALRPRATITLQGDLGVGKTTLSRGLLYYLGHEGPVKSPTYTLVEPYNLDCGTVYHFDLYRVIDPEELDYIGFSEYLSDASFSLIEWPEQGSGYLNTVDIRIKISHKGLGRQIMVSAHSTSGEAIFCRLKKIME